MEKRNQLSALKGHCQEHHVKFQECKNMYIYERKASVPVFDKITMPV